MSAMAVREVSVTRQCESLLGAVTERRLPFLLTYGQELEKCVLGTEIIPLNRFSHEQTGWASIVTMGF